jgi:hypothetical protein
MAFDFKRWFLALPDEAREQYADRAGTTAYYISKQLVGRRKVPRPDLMARLALASQGMFTLADLLTFFYQPGTEVERVERSGGQRRAAHKARNVTPLR